MYYLRLYKTLKAIQEKNGYELGRGKLYYVDQWDSGQWIANNQSTKQEWKGWNNI